MRKKDFRGLAFGMLLLFSLSGCSADAPTDMERTQSRQETTVVMASGEEIGKLNETTDQEKLEGSDAEDAQETAVKQEASETADSLEDRETSEEGDDPSRISEKESAKETTAKKNSDKEIVTKTDSETEKKKETASTGAEEETGEEEAPAEEQEAATQDTSSENASTTKPSTTKPASTKSETTKTSQTTSAKAEETKSAATAATTVASTTTSSAAAGTTAAAATTAAQTTATPTTAASTTVAPTTAASTTAAPTTAASTTTAVSHGDGGVMRSGMTSLKFRDEMGIGINLGNTMDAYWASDSRTNSGSQIIGQNTPANYETCWGGKVVTQSMIDSLKASGFQTVRIPVYWGNMMAEDGTFTIDEDYLARVAQIIDYCRQDGMYVVINIHHYDEYIIKNYPKDQALTIFKNLWSQIASYYKNYSDYLIFEGFNENVGSTYSGEALSENQIFAYANALNQTFVDAVRGTGGNNASRMLIISGYWTNIDKTTDSRFQMPTDSVSDRLMVSVHYVDNAYYWSNNIGGQSWLDYSISQCELLKKAFTDKGIVVFVGECTASYESDRIVKNAIYKDSASCTAKMLSIIMDYGFVPVFWDTTGNFYADSSSQAVTNSLLSALEQVKNN